MPYKRTPEGIAKRKEVALRWYRKHAEQTKASRILLCKHCGNSFSNAHGLSRFCSDSCRIARKNENKKRYAKQEDQLKKRRDYLARRWKEDPGFKLRGLVNSTVSQALHRWGGRKRGSILRYLPYSIPQLQAHLESFFDNSNGFSWDNHGTKWHIDHVIPHTLFKYTSLDSKEFRDAWALTNLRPAPCEENMEKHCDIGFFNEDGQKQFIS